ncbi:hypothetical protein DE146DRAFT_648076 [Phaeosphaeria sp. MPI-PUGE-AT-0046c]|nr:hypothetical protein DE146DRAFT_648076 [Phaeosphaeria sp. MPI-PUGE-AT-0046c]
MHFQLISVLAFSVATNAAPLVSASPDKCGNTDPGRACLVAKDQLHRDVAFSVAIGENNINVNEVIGKYHSAVFTFSGRDTTDAYRAVASQNPNFSIIGLELETAFVACTATCILIDNDGRQTPCEDLVKHGRTLSHPGDELNLSNVETLVAVDCQRVFPPIGH